MGGKLWKNPTFYRENSHQLQMEFCLNIATRIWPKEDESCMQRNCTAVVRPRVAFSTLRQTDAASAQQDARTHSLLTHVTDRATAPAAIIVLLMGM